MRDKMKLYAALITALLLATTGRTEDINKPKYASRYEQWLPNVTNTMVVTINVGNGTSPTSGLSSASFSAHHLLREPGIMRPDGTPYTDHAMVTAEEMYEMLKLVDALGPSANFSTCGDDNWREPAGDPTRIQVVWRTEGHGYTYDWFVIEQNRMPGFLQECLGAIQSLEARKVIEGLIEGNRDEKGEQAVAGYPPQGVGSPDP